MRPTEPPEFGGEEDLTEEEARERVEKMQKELEGKEMGEQAGRQPSPAGREMRGDVGDAWNKLLKPEFEGTELEGYEDQFEAFLMEVIPIANIRRQWIPRLLSYFDANWTWIKIKGVRLPPYLWASFRMVFELNLTRAIGGLQRKIQEQSQLQPQQIAWSLEEGWNQFLQPDFEGTEFYEYSKNFSSALSNVVPLANIQEGDIQARYLPYFDEIHQFLKLEGLKTDPQSWTQFRFIFEMNLSRAIEAFEMEKQAGFAEKMKEKKEERGPLESLREALGL